MASLFAQYIKEREAKGIVESEMGFATYQISTTEGIKSVYIEDVFVSKDYRKNGMATALANEVIKRAKLEGCTKAYTSVSPSAVNSTISVKVILANKFKLKNSTVNFIVFEKDI